MQLFYFFQMVPVGESMGQHTEHIRKNGTQETQKGPHLVDISPPHAI